MSDSNDNPGGIRPDPEGGGARDRFSLDDALGELQQRRRRPPREQMPRVTQTPREQAPPEPRDEPQHETAEHDELPMPFDAPEPHEARGDDAGQGDDEDGGGEQQSGESHFTVTIEGQTRQVPLSELISGYMRNADYTRKSSQVSEVQQQFAQAYQGFDVARQRMETALAQYVPAAEKEFQNVDWAQLAQVNPMEWVEKRARFDALNEAKAEQARLAQLREQETFARKQEMYRQGEEVLRRVIPAWREPTTRQQMQAQLKSFALELGFTEQEMNGEILDPRYIVALHDAMQYRRMNSRRVTPQPPANQPVLDRGSRPAPAQPTQRQRGAIETFNSTPSLDNAMELLRAKHGRRLNGNGRAN
jgi:hypothetical protein